jgi:hypothetical protein
VGAVVNSRLEAVLLGGKLGHRDSGSVPSNYRFRWNISLDNAHRENLTIDKISLEIKEGGTETRNGQVGLSFHCSSEDLGPAANAELFLLKPRRPRVVLAPMELFKRFVHLPGVDLVSAALELTTDIQVKSG